jgi:hypothetical protein
VNNRTVFHSGGSKPNCTPLHFSNNVTVPSEESRRVNFVMLGQRRNNVLPDAARAGDAMQKD